MKYGRPFTDSAYVASSMRRTSAFTGIPATVIASVAKKYALEIPAPASVWKYSGITPMVFPISFEGLNSAFAVTRTAETKSAAGSLTMTFSMSSCAKKTGFAAAGRSTTLDPPSTLTLFPSSATTITCALNDRVSTASRKESGRKNITVSAGTGAFWRESSI